MKISYCIQQRLSLLILIGFLISLSGYAQPKRLKPPKRPSKIQSVDRFVDNAFELYHNVFVYDSLTQMGVEVPSEIEDALVERAERDIDSLWQVLPTIVDDMSSGNANIMKKGKATINLNKSKKALKYCMQTVKAYFIGSKDDEEDNE
ncbi:hypothetical protein [Psychroserpens algicola]|uniref:Uncharacterized protein n=1 Tax=Psychroserpens algicola TaxID=1719034 RepID=A0ABT0HCB0_9FLAO|nr:hypothetical protein [Psychroserpens algicola]MCK8482009.1 hypothetical protein [Psychroserpens algicola]